jgi:hypothetical protein
MLQREPPYFFGIAFPITSAESLFSYVALRVQPFQWSYSDSPVLSWPSSSGIPTLPAQTSGHVIHLFIHSSRCLHGALRGNMGVVKSAMAELTDESNAPRGFSLLHMTWSVGFMIGSVTISIYYVLYSLIYQDF